MNTETSFRIKEDSRKIGYILQNSDITLRTIKKAAEVSVANPYHNFDHQLGVAEQAIKLAKAEDRNRSEINLVGVIGLFHDAGFLVQKTSFPEIRSFWVAERMLDSFDTRIVSTDHSLVLTRIRDYILATAYPSARTIETRQDPLKCIVQDADLAHLGQGPFYWVWASMGLLEEFNQVREEYISPEYFIRTTQEKFVKSLRELQEGRIFVSQGARKVFKDPVQSLKQIKKWPIEAINCAYAMRGLDIDIYQFESKISRFL